MHKLHLIHVRLSKRIINKNLETKVITSILTSINAEKEENTTFLTLTQLLKLDQTSVNIFSNRISHALSVLQFDLFFIISSIVYQKKNSKIRKNCLKKISRFVRPLENNKRQFDGNRSSNLEETNLTFFWPNVFPT